MDSEYEAEEIHDINNDIMDSLNMVGVPVDEWGMIIGKIKVTVELVREQLKEDTDDN
jgi:hypothetical protein